MNHPLEQLRNCTDIATLRPALHSICNEYGGVSRLDILPARHAGKQQALCFLRMNSHEEEERLMSALGVGRFAGDLVVVVDMQSVVASAGATA